MTRTLCESSEFRLFLRIQGSRLYSPIVLFFAVIIFSFAALATDSTSAEPQKTVQTQQSGKRQFDAALAAYRDQHFREAQNMLAPLAKSNPGSFEINELLGLVFVAQRQDDKANPFLQKAVRLRPEVAEARTALATNLLRLQRSSEAELQFKKVVELDPKSYDANHNLGEFYVQIGRLNDAIRFLKRAQEINPDAQNNGYDLALAYEKDARLEEARTELEALLARKDSPELHSLLAEVEEKSKNYLASAAQYQQAARMDPNEQNISDWGTELLLHQAFAPAVEVFKAGLGRYPQSVRIQLGLGIGLYGDGRYDDSAAAFLHAADMRPADSLPLTFLGKTYDALSPAVAEQVRDRFQSFLKMNATSSAVRYYYAMALWKLNEKEPHPELIEQIERLLKDAVSLDPTNTDAYLQLGIVYANRSEYKEAISSYEKALRLNPDLPNIHYRLGQVLMRTGDSARAQLEFGTFERLRAKQANGNEKEDSEIKQFVYTMRATQDPSEKGADSVPRAPR